MEVIPYSFGGVPLLSLAGDFDHDSVSSFTEQAEQALGTVGATCSYSSPIALISIAGGLAAWFRPCVGFAMMAGWASSLPVLMFFDCLGSPVLPSIPASASSPVWTMSKRICTGPWSAETRRGPLRSPGADDALLAADGLAFPRLFS